MGIIASFGMIPQLLKIYRRKSAEDISITTNLCFLFSSIVWILYGIELNVLPIILTRSIACLLISSILFGCFKFGKKGNVKNNEKKGILNKFPMANG